mmetsp:Transcript_22570/g.85517  ORF Transcript_22570/g.85517 Transcript_22570/m.85517 type:complete len:246 (+) Transcript_22570:3808-4545(+)
MERRLDVFPNPRHRHLRQRLVAPGVNEVPNHLSANFPRRRLQCSLSGLVGGAGCPLRRGGHAGVVRDVRTFVGFVRRHCRWHLADRGRRQPHPGGAGLRKAGHPHALVVLRDARQRAAELPPLVRLCHRLLGAVYRHGPLRYPRLFVGGTCAHAAATDVVGAAPAPGHGSGPRAGYPPPPEASVADLACHPAGVGQRPGHPRERRPGCQGGRGPPKPGHRQGALPGAEEGRGGVHAFAAVEVVCY